MSMNLEAVRHAVEQMNARNRKYFNPGKLRSMREAPPAGRLTAEIERQTTNTVIGKRVRQQYGDIGRGVDFSGT